jgi:hypothetical protein
LGYVVVSHPRVGNDEQAEGPLWEVESSPWSAKVKLLRRGAISLLGRVQVGRAALVNAPTRSQRVHETVFRFPFVRRKREKNNRATLRSLLGWFVDSLVSWLP